MESAEPGNAKPTVKYERGPMRLLRDNPGPMFDYVPLDRARTWAHDAMAFLLIDLVLQPGGYVDSRITIGPSTRHGQ
jgi:hypothetical protein